ncbi:hypothetical protein PR202_ga23099 [Eleusine coracana subsp. coracana]|uniref:Uncharacterized protein n=1 Tax=Eleusine coracana subsp. coracana TaxID=191504 RepID=A0AAV5D3F2_ELECO|nr:hypothetical protein PR202_ga23099 [Eleusine coracana subsp. coracana]
MWSTFSVQLSSSKLPFRSVTPPVHAAAGNSAAPLGRCLPPARPAFSVPSSPLVAADDSVSALGFLSEPAFALGCPAQSS